MVNITPEQLDAACAAYARSTGSYPNRAGLRAALHTINLKESLKRDEYTRQCDRTDAGMEEHERTPDHLR